VRDVTAMVVQERTELADLLDSLTPEQWAAPSLCEGWSVRDVALHVVSYEEIGTLGLLSRLARTPWRPWRLNEVVLAENAGVGPADVAALVRRHVEPRGATARMGGRVGLTDGIVHQQDVRRPLGLPRTVPPERLRVALGFALTAPPLRGAWRGRGVRLVATDCDWAFGRGPEPRGPGEAVLMTMAGRRGAADDLAGRGAEVLRGRART